MKTAIITTISLLFVVVCVNVAGSAFETFAEDFDTTNGVAGCASVSK